MSAEQAAVHVPVLKAEVLQWMQPRPGGVYVDATLGLGGHTLALLDQSAPSGQVVGFEWDRDARTLAEQRLAPVFDRVRIVQASYAQLVPELKKLGITSVDGLIADLGVSSLQLDLGKRGFSFKVDCDLDMRMNQENPITAASLIERMSEEQLADIFFHYGEERQSRRIARFLVEARQQEPVRTTGRLAAIVAAAIPRKYHPAKVHVATKVFQALRIAVNSELNNLAVLLATAPEVMAQGARIAIITFHSLEDRMVKQAFSSSLVYEPLVKRPIGPSLEERRQNPRARSAKLRVAKRR